MQTTLHALVAVLLTVPLLPGAATAQDARLLTVDVVHGAHGDAMVWRGGCGEQALIDAGNGMAEEVLDVLDRHGDRHLDFVSPSHADADHLGDVLDVTTAPDVTVGTYVDGFLSPDDHDTITFADYYATTRGSGNITVVDIGDSFTLCPGPDAVVFDVLAVGYDGTTVGGLPVTGPNDRGIVYRVTVTSATSPDGDDVALITAGDVNGTDGGGRADVEGTLVATYGTALAADWVKATHHGSFFSNTPPWIEAVTDGTTPHVVFPVGSNGFGHPAEVVVDDWTATVGADRVFQTGHGDGHPDEGGPADGTVTTVITQEAITTTGTVSGRTASTPLSAGDDGPSVPTTGEVTVTDVTNPYSHALDVSRARFPNGTRPAHVVIASGEVFADALAGAPLTGDGPLLYASDDTSVTGSVQDEIDRLMPGGGTVYLLGGPAAIEWEPLGHDVIRLAGPTRVQTALAIADTVQTLHGTDDPVDAFIVRADGPGSAGFADSVAIGGLAAETRQAVVLLTPSDTLHADVDAFLRGNNTAPHIIGGNAAVTDAVADGIADIHGTRPPRIAGPSRDATAAEIDRVLWGPQATGGLIVIEGYAEDAWTWGLVAAGRSADLDAPVLLTPPDGLADVTRDRIVADDGDVDLTGRLDPASRTVLVDNIEQAVDDRDTPDVTPLPDPHPDPTDDPDPTDEPVALPPGSDANGNIGILHIVFDPAGDDVAADAGEYVELVNTGQFDPQAINLDGWHLLDEADNRIDICPGYTLTPGDRLRIHTGPGTNDADDCFAGRGQAIWNNTGGDTATLYNDQSAYKASLSYDS